MKERIFGMVKTPRDFGYNDEEIKEALKKNYHLQNRMQNHICWKSKFYYEVDEFFLEKTSREFSGCFSKRFFIE